MSGGTGATRAGFSSPSVLAGPSFHLSGSGQDTLAGAFLDCGLQSKPLEPHSGNGLGNGLDKGTLC